MKIEQKNKGLIFFVKSEKIGISEPIKYPK